LTNLHKGGGHLEHAQQALHWFDDIETDIRAARADLEKTLKGEG
jgi:hypothetical protein